MASCIIIILPIFGLNIFLGDDAESRDGIDNGMEMHF